MSFDIWFSLWISSFFISISPGAGAITTINQSVCYGFKKSLYTIAGLQLGWGIQIILVSLGIGAFIVSHPMLFLCIKWMGVVYLVILGVQQWIMQSKKEDFQNTGITEHFNGFRHFMKALLINLLNLKATLFLLVFIPLFIQIENSKTVQISIILGTLVMTDMLVMAGYASASSIIRYRAENKTLFYLNRISGAVLILVGLSMAYRLENSF
jgi:homoserine/homoserine lactone efflux protein